jgi:hypothetical protein
VHRVLLEDIDERAHGSRDGGGKGSVGAVGRNKSGCGERQP